MRTSIKRALVLPAIVTSAAMIAPAAAVAHPGHVGVSGVSEEGVIAPGSDATKQHGGDTGHLPEDIRNVELVGQADIEGAAEGRVADVTAFGNYAYLTVRDPEGCADAGVAIMDISDPTGPSQVGFIDATEGSFPGEGAQILDVRTKRFTGQILLFNNEICTTDKINTGRGGVSMWDVTDPTDPVVLTEHAGDTTVKDEPNPTINDIHSVLGWTDRNKAYAVLVDNREGADVDILDITDPRRPVLVSETDLNTFDVLQEQATPLGGNSFLHDVEVQRIRGTMTMIASYWDGGWVLLDVDDPAKPVYMRDFDYSAVDTLTKLSPSEGNAHQAEFSPDGRVFIGTDEDFSPFRLSVTSGGVAFQASQGSDTPQLDQKTAFTGTPVFLGTACTVTGKDAPLTPGTKGQIAVVERGTCTFTEKAGSVDTAGGYAGVVLINNACSGIVTPSVQGRVPFVSVSRETGYKLLGAAFDAAACEAKTQAALTVGATSTSVLKAAAVFDGWGYVRLVDTQTMQEIDSYAIEESLQSKFASNFGDLSVHEVAVDPRNNGLAYLSYYSGGLRVVEYDRDGLREVGAYIDEDGNNFWGVEFHQLPKAKGNDKVKVKGKAARKAARNANNLILASDRDSGLWIFRYTGGK